MCQGESGIVCLYYLGAAWLVLKWAFMVGCLLFAGWIGWKLRKR